MKTSALVLYIIALSALVFHTKCQNTSSPYAYWLEDPYGGYSLCQDVRKVPIEHQCDFVLEHCDEESRKATLSLDYLATYYCSVQQAGNTAIAMFFLFGVFGTAILFLLLGDTAEKYFGPALTQISQQIPKMRPRFAGVTLLAIANGAPDLSSTINAIKTCKFDMSLGALTGGGMFVNCFVAGWVIRLSGGAKCRGATIRDISTYFITIFAVLISLIIGRIGVVFVVFAFALYLSFVMLVFGADEWHERGRPNFWSGPIEVLTRSLKKINIEADQLDNDFGERLGNEDGPLPVWAAFEDTTERLQTELLQYQRVPSPERSLPVVWANISPDRYRRQALAEMAESDDDLFDHPLDDIADDTQISDTQAIYRTEPGYSETERSSFVGGSIVAFETEQRAQESLQSKNKILLLVYKIIKEMLMEDLSNISLQNKILLIIRMPGIFLQRATIPLTSTENYSKNWLTISVTLSPILCLVFFDLLSWAHFALALVLGAIAGLLMYLLTKNFNEAPRWSMGTKWPIGSSIIALYGLTMGIFWIDLLAAELIDLLYCAGIVTGIPEAVLGLTVLAWGNSIGDFFTNTTIAKSGKGNMALTACYAGPVFNMLIGLGLGFSLFFSEQGTHFASVSAQRQVFLGCTLLLFHAAMVLFIGIRRGLTLPKNFGYFSISIYVIYLVLAVGMEIIWKSQGSINSAQC